MMKMFSYIVRFLLIMSVGASLSSCSGVDFPEGNVREERDYPVLLATSGVDTRISIDGTAMAWDEDDCIHLTAVTEDDARGEATLAFYNYLTEGDRHAASFSGFVTMASVPKECYFVYPQSSFSSVDPDSGVLTLYYNNQSGEHEPVLYAAAEYSESGVNETLTHVGAMLEIDVAMEGVSQITFVGNCLEKLSPVYVDTGSGEVTVASESSYNVQITVPVQSEGKTYIAVPPVNMKKGFSLICSNEDASASMIRTFSTDGGLSDGYDFSAKVGQVIPISLTGNLVGYSVMSSDPEIEHVRSNGLLTGTSVKFSMSKKGASDKIIEEWGANLIRKRNPLDPESKDVVVRTVSNTNENPIVSGADVEMTKVGNWHVLPAGDYTFAPYYKIYGQMVSLPSKDVVVTDPGISLTIGGRTSYDKYLAGDVAGANGHANTMIQDVTVTANVDLSIITEYSATLDGNDMGDATVTSGTSVVASYGDLTGTSFKAYPMTAVMKVGEITVTAQKTFHITGLPYEADFTVGNPFNWTETAAWNNVNGTMKYSDGRVNFPANSTASIRTPAYYIPAGSINVVTSVDACSNATQGGNRTISILSCTETQGSTAGTATVVASYHFGFASGFEKKGYTSCSTVFTLSGESPCLMYTSTTSLTYQIGFFMAKIEYSE